VTAAVVLAVKAQQAQHWGQQQLRLQQPQNGGGLFDAAEGLV
jgi:hypothetical protein